MLEVRGRSGCDHLVVAAKAAGCPTSYEAATAILALLTDEQIVMDDKGRCSLTALH